MGEIGVKELDEMIAESFRLKKQYQEAKKISNEFHAKAEAHNQKCIEVLQELGRTKYSCDAGTFAYKIVESFRVPKTPEARAKFFAFLQEKGVYEDLISVNSMTLNSWAKAEIESSMEMDYQIPGLEKSDPVFRASMIKGR